jgi:hypothetical protein
VRERIAGRAGLIALCAAALLAPAADGASPGLVLDHSIGGISLGETRAHAGHGEGSAGARVWYAGGTVIATFVHGRVVVVETSSARYRTRTGIGVGSSLAKVRSVGRIRCFDANTECQHGYKAMNRPGTTFRLDRPGGHVRWIGMAYGH